MRRLIALLLVALLATPLAAVADPLPSWNPTTTKAAIIDFVARVSDDSSDDFVPAEEIAGFDNDGTLWSEQPIYFQFAFATDAGGRTYESYGGVSRDDDTPGTRAVIVVGPDGRIAHVMPVFRQTDPTAYEELAAAIDRITPAP